MRAHQARSLRPRRRRRDGPGARGAHRRHPPGRRAPAAIEDRPAERAEAFHLETVLGAKEEQLECRQVTFFDIPAEHWKHLRTSNVIESPFATVRLRQRVTKGAGSRTKGLLKAYKLLDMSQARWRRLDGAHLLPLVRAGISFMDGAQQEGKAGKPKAKAA
jgi:hypothetical protein